MNILLSVVLAAALPVPGPAPDTLDWRACGNDAQCAALTVPVDWSHPRGATIELAVARRPAIDQQHKAGTLVFGPGGPWDSGVSRVTDGYRRFSDTLLNRFDIVSFDPRGSNGSHPVACDPEVVAGAPDPILHSQAEFDATLRYNRTLWDGCAARTGALWKHADMSSNVRDLDALRAALGVPTLSFHGSSYGTLLGEAYAERYPGRVRAMVLESVVDHSSRSTAEFLTAQSQASEDAFDDFADWCDADVACATSMHGRGVRVVWNELYRTHSRFDLVAITYKLTKDRDYRKLAGYLASVARGGPEMKVGSLGVVTPAFCGDWSIPVRDYAEYASLLRRAESVAPDTHFPAQVFALTMCLGWPHAGYPQHDLRLHTAVPVLLLNSRHDSATGLNWASSVARQLGRRAVLVVHEGAGHGSYTVSDCMRSTADDYLVSLTVPARGTTCPAVPIA